MDTLSSFLPMVLILGVFYLFFIRPQAKAQKEQSKFQEEMAKGDLVVTNSGIIGRINKIDKDIVTVQVDGKTFVRLHKKFISKENTAALQPLLKDMAQEF